MNSNFAKAAFIGVLMGGAVALLTLLNTPYKIFGAIAVCILGGPITVCATGKNANLWAGVAVLFASPLLFLALGTQLGMSVTAVFAIGYAICAVQITQVFVGVWQIFVSVYRKVFTSA